MNYKKYPKYKNSGIAWLGEIPEHWEVRSVRNSFLFETGFTPSTEKDYYYDENGFTWITIADLKGKYLSKSKLSISHRFLNENSKNIVLKGSLLYSFKLSVGKVAFAQKDLYTNEAIFSILPNLSYDLRYYYYSLPKQIIKNASENIYGAKMLNQKLIKQAKIVFPPKPEQTAIANFLDYKLEKIDRFITKKKQLIKLLNEKKAAIINQAVTKGVPPNDELKNPNSQFTTHNLQFKDSGIEWLGDIPEHWNSIKLKFLTKITTGDKNTEDKVENGIYDFFVRSQTIEKINTYTYDGEGILTAGDGVGVGRVFHYVNGKFDFHQRVYLFYDFSEKVYPKFLFYYLKENLKTDLMLYNAKSTVDSVRIPTLKNFIVAQPTIQEQKAIVTHIETETAKIEQTITTIEKEIALVEEYKTALIAEAVTGKIDVRKWSETLTIND